MMILADRILLRRESRSLMLCARKASIQKSATFELRRKAILSNLARAVKQADHERVEIQRGLENAARAAPGT